MANKKDHTPTFDSINPTLCVGRRLNALSRVFTKIYSRRLKDAGVTLTQSSIMFAIGKMQSVHQSELGKKLHLERSTVTRDLDRLIKRNYIRKIAHPISPILEMTTEGKAFLEVFTPLWNEAQKEALDILGQEGQEALTILSGLLK